MVEVSVVIPVFNDFNAIKLTLESLSKQSADRNRFEVIVIDNGSTDGSVDWLAQQPDITFLEEKSYSGSPYSCRNRGLEVAKGKVIALLDSTCIPDEKWMEKGLEFIKSATPVFFGGAVRFHCAGNKTAAKLYDSITHVQMESAIKQKQEAKTANLWVSKSLFDEFGMFREGVRSGEDVRWSSHCAANGYKLLYSPDTIVYKFARGFSELMNKQFRIGKGQVVRWRSQGVVLANFLKHYKTLIPMRPGSLKRRVATNPEFSYSTSLAFKLYIIDYCARFTTLAGNIIGLFKSSKD